MSYADTQFEYHPANDGRTLSATYRTVAGGDRPGSISAFGSKMGSPVRRSSSVTSSNRYRSASRDVGLATLHWSKRSYTVQELAQEFKRRFPVLVRVTQGYCCSNANAFKLDVGQVSYL